MSNYLTSEGAETLVKEYMEKEAREIPFTTQDILDSGKIQRLKGYGVKPGKVSDSIFEGYGRNPPLNTKDEKPIRIMVRTEGVSTHDIKRGTIPFKDQIIAMNHNFMRKLVEPVLGTSQFEVEGLDDNSIVIAAENLNTIMFENVLRAYMAKSSTSTSLYQHFMKGKREFCGHILPEDLIPNGPLPYVMDTPSTKAERDESISPDYLFKNHICTSEEYNEIRNSSLVGFGAVSRFLDEKGIVIVDTKTEHGKNTEGKIVSQDELYTMDSSRFWLKKDYHEQLAKLKRREITELAPISYSKEFGRGISVGEERYTDEQRAQIAVRYIEGIQYLLGKTFEPDTRSRRERVISGLEQAVKLAA